MNSLRIIAIVLLAVAGGMSLAGVDMAPRMWQLPAGYLALDATVRVWVFFRYELPTPKRK